MIRSPLSSIKLCIERARSFLCCVRAVNVAMSVGAVCHDGTSFPVSSCSFHPSLIIIVLVRILHFFSGFFVSPFCPLLFFQLPLVVCLFFFFAILPMRSSSFSFRPSYLLPILPPPVLFSRVEFTAVIVPVQLPWARRYPRSCDGGWVIRSGSIYVQTSIIQSTKRPTDFKQYHTRHKRHIIQHTITEADC